jgi:hypothetical protein
MFVLIYIFGDKEALIELFRRLMYRIRTCSSEQTGCTIVLQNDG